MPAAITALKGEAVVTDFTTLKISEWKRRFFAEIRNRTSYMEGQKFRSYRSTCEELFITKEGLALLVKQGTSPESSADWLMFEVVGESLNHRAGTPEWRQMNEHVDSLMKKRRWAWLSWRREVFRQLAKRVDRDDFLCATSARWMRELFLKNEDLHFIHKNYLPPEETVDWIVGGIGGMWETNGTTVTKSVWLTINLEVRCEIEEHIAAALEGLEDEDEDEDEELEHPYFEGKPMWWRPDFEEKLRSA
jgi:hypothetical protein